jgi:phosphatidylserine/phosphatidylglycerophosphate/cardiolipin synthase-like enzyme
MIMPEYLERKREYHSVLLQKGVSLFYDDQVHAKIIVADDKVAIVSSMNFFANSSAGASWEAGLVTINSQVVKSIANSFSKMVTDISNSSRRSKTEKCEYDSTGGFEFSAGKKLNNYNVEEIRKKYPRAYETWTNEEDNRLVEEFRKVL